MYKRLLQNLDYVKEFLEVNNLGINFTCNYTFENSDYEVDIDCEAFVSFDTSKHKIEIFVSCRLENEKLPTSFASETHEFDIEYGILFIYGKKRKLGVYKAVITPYENICII